MVGYAGNASIRGQLPLRGASKLAILAPLATVATGLPGLGAHQLL
jgi:hypothetical protein